MTQYVVKRRFQSLILTGITAALMCFAVALIYWPLWGSITKAIISRLAGTGLAQVDPKTTAKYFACFAEATFFWLVINAWIWHSLIFGGYGKTKVTERQPGAGIWYALVGVLSGLVGFLLIVGFPGIWWKPFSFGILFTPQTAEQVHMAIEGWEASNFYALCVIMVQIPFVSLLQKWPFAGNIKAPWDSFGVMMMATTAALIAWIAMIIPSLMALKLGEEAAVMKPMGSWPTFVAFCQSFIWTCLIPAEGGEQYPMRFFAKKQPYMALAGFIIALAMGFIIPAVLRPIVTGLNLLPGAPVDLVVASLMLSVIVCTLLWHHVFDDYPTAQMVPNQAARVLIRIGTWLVLGFGLGTVWVRAFKMLPFGGNDLGRGIPTMGILAGQFGYLMVFLYYNTFFDKWPLVKKVRLKTVKAAAGVAKR
jgi:hypothetical protein